MWTITQPPKFFIFFTQRDDSEDDEYALSENWQFEHQNRRWSRVGDQMAADIAAHFGGSSDGCTDSGITSSNTLGVAAATGKSAKLAAPQTHSATSTSISSTSGSGGDKSNEASCDSSTEKLLLHSSVIAAAAAIQHNNNNNNPSTLHMLSDKAAAPDDSDAALNADGGPMPVRFRRTGSERLKDGAKALLRRVESIKSRRRKRQNRDGIVCEPAELDLSGLSTQDIGGAGIGYSCAGSSSSRSVVARSQPPSPLPGSPYRTLMTPGSADQRTPDHQYRLSPLNYATLGGKTPQQTRAHQHSLSQRTSPLHFFQQHLPVAASGSDFRNAAVSGFGSADESSSYFSDASQESSTAGGGTPQSIPNKKRVPSRTRRFLQKGIGLGSSSTTKVEDCGAMSDSECHHMFGVHSGRKVPATTAVTLTQPSPTAEVAAAAAAKSGAAGPVKLQRGGSLNLGKDANGQRRGFKSRSFRSRSSCRKADYSTGLWPDGAEGKASKGVVLRWHSFQSPSQRQAEAGKKKTASVPPEFLFRKCGPGVVISGAAGPNGAGGELMDPDEEEEDEAVVAEAAQRQLSEELDASGGMPLAAMSCGQIQVGFFLLV